jgi:DNA-binding HxlR family transcriptional regulator
MRRTRFDDWDCSVARTVDLLGDWWTPMVVRCAFLGARRFEQFQECMGIPRNVLAARLKSLVGEGVLEKRAYQDRPVRHEYRLTDKGIALYPVIITMMKWGDEWLDWPDGVPPVELLDRETGEPVEPLLIDARTGERLDPRRVRARWRRAEDPGWPRVGPTPRRDRTP